MLGTVTRSDGSHQVTYNNLPLYTFTGDSAAGQTNGQGVVEQYGAVSGTWSVVAPASSAAKAGATTTTGAPAGAVGGVASTTVPPATTAPPATTVPPATTTTKPAAWS